MSLTIVTATTDPIRAEACIQSWDDLAAGDLRIIIVVNGRPWSPGENRTELQATWICLPNYVGTVPAFKAGVDHALLAGGDVIACLHDDFRIGEANWDRKVLKHFERYPNCGLAGFGGAKGLGSEQIYQEPYNPMQLARIGFRSNLVDAEIHGYRSLLPEKVACLDGFSQIGRQAFWLGYVGHGPIGAETQFTGLRRPWNVLADLGMVHHFYDGALGCLAKRQGWDVWYLPLYGQHYGGRTAVGDTGYVAWAGSQISEGDHGFWKAAHRAGYEAFRDVLPLRT